MTEYRFPSWRRVGFAAALIVILVVSLGPSISQGTLNVRVYGSPSNGVVTHVFVKFSQVEFHTAGFADDAGWVTITQLVPQVDLVATSGEFIPDTLLSSRVQSGRYDSIKITVSNATVVISNTQRTPVSGSLTLNAKLTIPIPPNGSGDVLVVLILDFTQLLDNPPSLNLQILQATAA